MRLLVNVPCVFWGIVRIIRNKHRMPVWALVCAYVSKGPFSIQGVGIHQVERIEYRNADQSFGVCVCACCMETEDN